MKIALIPLKLLELLQNLLCFVQMSSYNPFLSLKKKMKIAATDSTYHFGTKPQDL